MSAPTGSTTFVPDPTPEVAPHEAPEAVHPQYVQSDLRKEARRSDDSPPQRWISKLGPVPWSILLVVLTATVVGGAIGGGLGAKLAECQSKPPRLRNVTVANSTACPTADLSNYTAAAPDTVSLLFSGCPDVTSQHYMTRFNESFTITCGVDSLYGVPTIEGSQKSLQVRAALIAYSLDDCIEACSAYSSFNERSGDSQLQCKSVSWDRRMEEAMGNNHVNCWLKNGTTASNQWTRQDNVVVAMID